MRKMVLALAIWVFLCPAVLAKSYDTNKIRQNCISAKKHWDKINAVAAKLAETRWETGGPDYIYQEKADLNGDGLKETTIYDFFFCVTGYGCKVKIFHQKYGKVFSTGFNDRSTILLADVSPDYPGKEIISFTYRDDDGKAHFAPHHLVVTICSFNHFEDEWYYDPMQSITTQKEYSIEENYFPGALEELLKKAI